MTNDQQSQQSPSSQSQEMTTSQTQTQATTEVTSSTQPKWLSKLLTKITSRKFIMCVAGTVIGTAGIIGFNENTVAIIVFGIIDIISILGYIIAEGTVDKASVESAIDVASKVAEALQNGTVSNKNMSSFRDQHDTTGDTDVSQVTSITDSTETK